MMILLSVPEYPLKRTEKQHNHCNWYVTTSRILLGQRILDAAGREKPSFGGQGEAAARRSTVVA